MKLKYIIYLLLTLSLVFACSETTISPDKKKEDPEPSPASSNTCTPEQFGAKADGTTDDTKAIQAAMDSEYDTIAFAAKTYITHEIVIQRSNVVLKMTPETVIKAAEGFKKDEKLIRIGLFETELENITVLGNGAILTMNKQEYIQDETSGHCETRHCFALSGGCKNVSVFDLNCNNSGGDGFIIGSGIAEWGACKNIKLIRCNADNNYRNGLSIINTDGLLVEDCVFKNTKGTSPEYGIDIEQETNCVVKNIKIINCLTQGNNSDGLAVGLWRAGNASDYTSRNDGNGLYILNMNTADNAQTTISASNIKIYSPKTLGVNVSTSDKGGSVNIDGMYIENVNPEYLAMYLGVNVPTGTSLANVDIRNVEIVNNDGIERTTTAVWMTFNSSIIPHDVTLTNIDISKANYAKGKYPLGIGRDDSTQIIRNINVDFGETVTELNTSNYNFFYAMLGSVCNKRGDSFTLPPSAQCIGTRVKYVNRNGLSYLKAYTGETIDGKYSQIQASDNAIGATLTLESTSGGWKINNIDGGWTLNN